jgi:hypothetical protein
MIAEKPPPVLPVKETREPRKEVELKQQTPSVLLGGSGVASAKSALERKIAEREQLVGRVLHKSPSPVR